MIITALGRLFNVFSAFFANEVGAFTHEVIIAEMTSSIDPYCFHVYFAQSLRGAGDGQMKYRMESTASTRNESMGEQKVHLWARRSLWGNNLLNDDRIGVKSTSFHKRLTHGHKTSKKWPFFRGTDKIMHVFCFHQWKWRFSSIHPWNWWKIKNIRWFLWKSSFSLVKAKYMQDYVRSIIENGMFLMVLE